MQKAPKSILPDDALDTDRCRQAVEEALKLPEPRQAFDRSVWLAKTKVQLKRYTSARLSGNIPPRLLEVRRTTGRQVLQPVV